MAPETAAELAERVDALLAGLGNIADPSVRAQARELACALMEMYGAGLEHVVRILAQSQTGRDVLRRIAGDGLVSSLLSLHGLHPATLPQRVADTVDHIRNAYGTRFEITVLSASPAGVHLRLIGNPDSAAREIRESIERALRAAAPDADAIEVHIVLSSQMLQVLRPGDIPSRRAPQP